MGTLNNLIDLKQTNSEYFDEMSELESRLNFLKEKHTQNNKRIHRFLFEHFIQSLYTLYKEDEECMFHKLLSLFYKHKPANIDDVVFEIKNILSKTDKKIYIHYSFDNKAYIENKIIELNNYTQYPNNELIDKLKRCCMGRTIIETENEIHYMGINHHFFGVLKRTDSDILACRKIIDSSDNPDWIVFDFKVETVSPITGNVYRTKLINYFNISKEVINSLIF